jgi:predicted amidohydrolase YtcJ
VNSGIHPDVILINGKIVTMDAGNRERQAIAIRGEMIVATGSDAEILALAGPATRLVDLERRTVIPGLMDAHFQFFDRAPLGYLGADTSLATSVADVLDAVREAARRVPTTEVITSNPGWYPHMLGEGRPPTRAELDAAAPNHAVVLRGEFLYCNSKALQRFNISRDTPQPANGWIGKDAGTGEPTGVLIHTAANLVESSYRHVTEDQRIELLRRAMQEMLAAGVTSVRDPKLQPADIRTYQKLHQRYGLPLRLSCQRFVPSTYSPEEVVAAFETGQLLTPIGDHWFRIDRAGYFYLDGGYHRMKCSVPFAQQNDLPDDGRSHYEGEQTRESLEEILVALASREFTCSIMAAGDVATEIAAETLEAVDRKVGIAGKRWVVAHAIWPSDRQLRRFARLGVILTPMWHHYYYYPTEAYYFGDEFARRTDPFRRMIDAGVTVAMGTDVSKIPLNYFAGIYFMVTRNTWKWGVADASQKISRLEALRTMTVNCAYLTFEEDIKGSLEPGKLADMVVLSNDLLTVPEEHIREIRPIATIVGGQVAFRDPTFTGWPA